MLPNIGGIFFFLCKCSATSFVSRLYYKRFYSKRFFEDPKGRNMAALGLVSMY
ncbi:MAG: hypothetical protein ACPGXZ_17890 [Saprospiraceae bacterium]